MMSLAEEGAYRRLLDFCWINGWVPADAQKVARLIGKGCSVEIAKTVLEMFVADENDESKMIHDRLEVERAKQKSNSNARRKASAARWNKESEYTEASGKQAKSKTNANAMQMDMQNVSSSIASSTSVVSEEKPPPPKSENQEEYLLRKQFEFPHLDVQKVFKKYIKDCQNRRIEPKRPFFDSWLENEFEPLTEPTDTTASDMPTVDEVIKNREQHRQNRTFAAEVTL